MRRTRRPAVALAVLATVGLTAGCEKPTPIVTITAGGASAHTEASRYCFAAGSCRDTGRPLPTLRVRPGQQVLIDVDEALVDDGWFVTDGKERSPVQDDTSYRFVPQTFGERGVLQLRVQTANTEGDRPGSGVWFFTLLAVD